MIVVHVAVTAAPDYATRRTAFRQAHLDRLLALRERGTVVGGGPAPDGRTADLFYRLRRPDDLTPIVEEDPYWTGGVWTGYRSRSFDRFVEPWEAVPLVSDGSRRATIVEGPANDPDMAQLALVELRGARRLALGGTFDGRDTLAVLRSADAAEAAAWLGETGFWAAERLAARPWLHVL
jgi:uncharacterized protein YciI